MDLPLGPPLLHSTVERPPRRVKCQDIFINERGLDVTAGIKMAQHSISAQVAYCYIRDPGSALEERQGGGLLEVT